MKKILSLLLMLCMLTSVIAPTLVFAETTNLALGKSYVISEQFRQGGADVGWGYDENALAAYPDDNYELTDGCIPTEASYGDSGWMAFNANTPAQKERGYAYIIMDLGSLCDLGEASLTVLNAPSAGISSPYYVEYYVSENNRTWDLANAYKCESSTETNIVELRTSLSIPARFVEIRVYSYGWAFLSELEIYGSDGGASEEPEESKNLASGKEVANAKVNGANSIYCADLTDGVIADAISTENGVWFGYYYNANLDADRLEEVTNTNSEGVAIPTIDLGGKCDLESARLHIVDQPDWGVLAPSSVIAQVSNDGKTFTDIATVSEFASGVSWVEFDLSGQSARYVRLAIDLDSAWLFLDEIEIYGTEAAGGDVDESFDEPSEPEESDIPDISFEPEEAETLDIQISHVNAYTWGAYHEMVVYGEGQNSVSMLGYDCLWWIALKVERIGDAYIVTEVEGSGEEKNMTAPADGFLVYCYSNDEASYSAAGNIQVGYLLQSCDFDWTANAASGTPLGTLRFVYGEYEQPEEPDEPTESVKDLLGEPPANPYFDLTMDLDVDTNGDLVLTVTAENFAEGLELECVFAELYFDESALTLLTPEGNDNALQCISKIPSSGYENLCCYHSETKCISIGVLSFGDAVPISEKNPLELVFTFELNNGYDFADFCIPHASVIGTDSNFDEYDGNGGYVALDDGAPEEPDDPVVPDPEPENNQVTVDVDDNDILTDGRTGFDGFWGDVGTGDIFLVCNPECTSKGMDVTILHDLGGLKTIDSYALHLYHCANVMIGYPEGHVCVEVSTDGVYYQTAGFFDLTPANLSLDDAGTVVTTCKFDATEAAYVRATLYVGSNADVLGESAVDNKIFWEFISIAEVEVGEAKAEPTESESLIPGEGANWINTDQGDASVKVIYNGDGSVTFTSSLPGTWPCVETWYIDTPIIADTLDDYLSIDLTVAGGTTNINFFFDDGNGGSVSFSISNTALNAACPDAFIDMGSGDLYDGTYKCNISIADLIASTMNLGGNAFPEAAIIDGTVRFIGINVYSVDGATITVNDLSVVHVSDDEPEETKTYENTLAEGENGNYYCEVPYGYLWNVNYIDGKIRGEDVTICTTQDAYNSCNPNWAITVVLEKQADGTYVALRDAIAYPGSASGSGVSLGEGQIALVVHSAYSNPSGINWLGKVVAMSVKAGDVFVVDFLNQTVYAVIPGEEIDITICKHTNMFEQIIESTCIDEGSINTYCGDCGALLGTESLPLGVHQYDSNGVCTVCYQFIQVEVMIESAKVKKGDVFTVALALNKNSGFNYLQLRLQYDKSVFELLSVGDATDSLTHISGVNEIWSYTSGDWTGTGNLVYLEFRVLDDAAEGNYFITADNIACNDYDENDVSVALVSGHITVVGCEHEQYTSYYEIEETCTTDGILVYVCMDCGVEFARETIPASGHLKTYWDTIYNPSCEEDGMEALICAICGDWITSQSIPAYGHNEVTETYDPTCETDGFTVTYCLNCGVESSRVTVPAPGHLFKDGICIFCDAARVPAKGDVVVTIDECEARAGDTFTVDIYVEETAGFCYLSLYLQYDQSVMELVSVENGEMFVNFMQGKVLLWADYIDRTEPGVLATLTFRVKDDAEEGTYRLTVVPVECSNADEQEVNAVVNSGSLTVTNVVYGDVNGDGAVNSKDATRLLRYLANRDPFTGISSVEVDAGADANGDGQVTGKDATRLLSYLANLDPFTGESSVVLGPQ